MTLEGPVDGTSNNRHRFRVMLFVLGTIPSFIGAVKKELQNFQVVFPKRSWINNIKADLWASGDIWLLVGGGLMMIVGLLVLLASKNHPRLL